MRGQLKRAVADKQNVPPIGSSAQTTEQCSRAVADAAPGDVIIAEDGTSNASSANLGVDNYQAVSLPELLEKLIVALASGVLGSV